jgi:hypothetical protein
MNRIVDIAVITMIACAGAAGPLRTASTIATRVQAGHPAARVAVRPRAEEASLTGTTNEALAQSCLTAGTSAAPFYLCPAGRNELHMSRLPNREPPSFPAMKPLNILSQN